MTAITMINTTNYTHEVTEAHFPVLLEFYAPWCHYCHHFRPILDEVAEAFKDRLKVCMINVEDHSSLAQEFQVGFLPSLFFLMPEKPPELLLGISDKPELMALLEKRLPKSSIQVSNDLSL